MLRSIVGGGSRREVTITRVGYPETGSNEVYVLPLAPNDAAVVACRLPGGRMCTCAVPALGAFEVRAAIASALRVPISALREFSLLIEDLESHGSLQLWNEAEPLPASFFTPTRRRAICYRRRRWTRATMPTLHMHRLSSPAHAEHTSRSEADAAALALLDSEQVLEDLRRGNYSEAVLSPTAAAGVCAVALVLGVGSADDADVIHTRDVLAPAASSMLAPRLAALVRHERACMLLDAHADVGTPAVAAARAELLSRLAGSLPVLRLRTPRADGSGFDDHPLDLRRCHLFTVSVRARGRQQRACEVEVAIGGEGVALLRQRGASVGVATGTEAVDALLLRWAAVRDWHGLRHSLRLVLASSEGVRLRQALGTACVSAPRAGGDPTICLNTPQAGLMDCIMRTHAGRGHAFHEHACATLGHAVASESASSTTCVSESDSR